MKICSYCGGRMYDTSAICPECGASENGLLLPDDEYKERRHEYFDEKPLEKPLNNSCTKQLLEEVIELQKKNLKMLKSISSSTAIVAAFLLFELIIILLVVFAL